MSDAIALRTLAREATAKALRWSGVPRWLRYRHRGDATLVLYHDPKPAILDAHLAYLTARFTPTTLDVVVDAIAARDWSRVPEHALVVTLDDGHRGNFGLLDVFRRHGVRPVLYLCSQIVTTRRHFWFQHPGVRPGAYKGMRNAERLAALARDHGFDPAREFSEAERQALSREEILALAPFVDFGAHTCSHPILPQCSDAEARLEIEQSKREVEALVGRACRHLAFPNGDYREREVALAREAGFASARTVDLGWTCVGSDPYRLKVFGISDDVSVDMLAAQLSGVAGYLRRRLQGQPGGLWPVTPAAARGAA